MKFALIFSFSLFALLSFSTTAKTVTYTTKYTYALPSLWEAPIPPCGIVTQWKGTGCGIYLFSDPDWVSCPECGGSMQCSYLSHNVYNGCSNITTSRVIEQNWVGPVKVCPPGFNLTASYNSQGQLYNYRCNGPDDKTPPQSCPATPHPVAITTGGKFLEERDIDKPFNFSRYYTTRSVDPAYLGNQWRHTFDRRVDYHSGPPNPAAVAYRPNGRMIFYTELSTGFVPDPDDVETLTKLADTNGNLTGWQLKLADDSTENYSSFGHLTSIVARNGYTQTLSYNVQDFLATVVDSFGRSLTFSYDSNFRITQIADSAGVVYRYGRDSSGRLTTATFPDSGGGTRVRAYQYANTSYPDFITGIVDENASQFASYTYTSGLVATSALWATPTQQVDQYALVYDSGNTVVTDPVGTKRTFSYQSVVNVRKSTGVSQAGTSCGTGNDQALSYDTSGNVSSRTDFNNKTVCYSHDTTRNLETARLEGALSSESCAAVLATPPNRPDVRKIATTWNPTYRLPATIVEPAPGGTKTTTFTYDGSGNLTQKSSVAPANDGSGNTITRTWNWTYTTLGRVLTATDPDNHTTTTTYYTDNDPDLGKRGNVQAITNAVGHVTAITAYDLNGRPLSITDPDGLTTALTYHPRGWLIARQVGAELTSYAYDGVGQLVEVTLPDGSYIHYTYDGAHRLTQINDSLGNKIVYTLDAMGNRIKEEAFDPSNSLARTRQQVFDNLNRLHQSVGAQ